MRDLTAQMKTYLEGEGFTLVTMWVVTTTDGTVIRSTDYSESINYYGDVFNNLDGMGRTAVQLNSNMTDDNLEASGFVGLFGTREELLGGQFDYAEIQIFLINPFDHSMGTVSLLHGNLADITVQDDQFQTSIVSKLSALNVRIGLACSPSCRAELGDSKCGVSLAPISGTGAVLGVGVNTFAVSLSNSLLIFPQGKLTWTSGPNTGGVFEIKNYSLGNMTLYVEPPFPIEVSDTFDVVQGCDKAYITCETLYSNTVNFRGEPDIPGSNAYFTRIERRDTVTS